MTTETVLPPTPTTTAAPDAPPRLQRGRTGTKLGGVCRGLADGTGIDVVLWRVGFLVLALTGAGVLLYPLLWVALPAAPLPAGAEPAPLDGFVERWHTRLTGALSGTRRA